MFFTNFASGLLRSELNVSLTRIPVYPTNQYLPAVHRLLQVTANIYCASRNSPYPVIYRPYFSREGTNVFISGYEEVDAMDDGLLAMPLDLADPLDRATIFTNTRTNIYGIPWIIGAKKGFPNFNELCLQSLFQITRPLQIVRNSTSPFSAPVSSYRIQQECLIGISNVLAVEFWNSYRTNFATPVDILVAGDLMYSLTNSDGIQFSGRIVYGPVETNVNQWPGIGQDHLPARESFLVPLRTNFTIVPLIAYRHSPPGFFSNTNAAAFEQVFAEPVLWGLSFTNRMRVLIRETGTGRVLDYVQFSGPGSYRNLSEEIRTPNSMTSFAGLWSTNLAFSGICLGIQNQIDISLGNGQMSVDWNTYGVNQAVGPTRDWEIDNFRSFYYLSPLFGNSIQNTNLVQRVPFTPTRVVVQDIRWEVNDPLVHYLADDLALPPVFSIPLPGGPFTNFPTIGQVNDRYSPWGGSPIYGPGPFARYAGVKDPLVKSSEDWNFPVGIPPSVAMIGRIHRGTPWQTIYLKALDVTSTSSGRDQWRNWLGYSNADAAVKIAPKRDWAVASQLAQLLNTNDVRTLFSPNTTDTNLWVSLLGALSAWTNIVGDNELFNTPPQFNEIAIGSSPNPANALAAAIQSTKVNQPGQFFRDPGDILATPQLTTSSPWLNLSSMQLNYGITDEAYERIPSQLLPLLRADSVGSIDPSVGGLLLSFSGYDGYSYSVESSSNLLTWTTHSTHQPTNGTFSLTIPDPTIADSQFYRSRLQP